MRTSPFLGAAFCALLLASCTGGGGPATGARTDIDLKRIDVGRLADLYGYRTVDDQKVLELVERDVLLGPDIQDQREGNSTKRDFEVTYDFIAADPETLQPRLLIPREIGSDEFEAARRKLDDNLVGIASLAFGHDPSLSAFSVIPRNGAIRITFSKDLGLSEDFFLAKDAGGIVQGIGNPRAVQLLEIVGDPTDNDHARDFRPVPVRIAYKGDRLILDPVMLGTEGRTFNVPNNASGLPASPDSVGANIRLAIALEGVLRIGGLRVRHENLVGRNLEGVRSMIRDFRSGNANDSNVAIANGFFRDTTALRLVGEMPMRLERVEVRSPVDQRLVLYKAGIEHELDRGDVLKLFASRNDERPAAIAEIIADPVDDRERPEEQHVVVRVRNAAAFAAVDPSRDPDYPTSLREREPWLVRNAPVVVVATEFNGEKNDDPVNFVTFSPEPVPDPGKASVARNENVSPHASALIRFNKPVDRTSLRPFDSMIFATDSDPVDVLNAKKGTPRLVVAQINDEDGSQTAFRSTPVLGLYIDAEVRKDPRKYSYWLHVVGGLNGIKDLAGNTIDFQYANKSREFVSFRFSVDGNVENGLPRFPDNRVVTIARRFLDLDEDESRTGLLDAFGAGSYQDGWLVGRPSSRVTSWHDDRNQLPSPPNMPLVYCPPEGRVILGSALTAATPFPAAIQNPLNPLGCRLQTIWREIDLSLSRTHPFDMNLDVEAMWWAPFQSSASAPKTEFDVFDRISLHLGHSERRGSNCVGIPNSLPQYEGSGLWLEFWENYLRSKKPDATTRTDRTKIEERPEPHLAFADKELRISHSFSVFEPNGVNRYLPLPQFDTSKGLFTWRDERLLALGGGGGEPQLLSPFKSGWWNNSRWNIAEEGRVGAIALPLLADFSVYPDRADLPEEDPFPATGFNGWQVSLVVSSQRRALGPYFPRWRVYSGGYRDGSSENPIDPGNEPVARGGWDPTLRQRTWPGDPVSYWARFDFLKRISLMTYGFIDIADPHDDAQNEFDDPRLGPFQIGANEIPRFEIGFDPPLSELPAGTKVIAEFRGADEGTSSFERLHPGVAGEAHVRSINSFERKWLSYQHTKRLTRYAQHPDQVYDPSWLRQFDMSPRDVRLMNFRLIFENNVAVDPPRTPRIDSFYMTYRIEEAK